MKRLLLILPLLAVLAGCGQSADQKYIHAVNAAQDKYGARIAAVAAQTGDAKYTAQANELNALARDLGQIKPPKKVADIHEALVGEVRDAANTVRAGGDLTLTERAMKQTINSINGELK
jgi:hypothetical protein